MKINWEKWCYYNADMFMRHLGTAMMASVGSLWVAGELQVKPFLVGLITGAILPSIATILKNGLPKPDDDECDT